MFRKHMEKTPCSLDTLIFCIGNISTSPNEAFSLKYVLRKANENFRFE